MAVASAPSMRPRRRASRGIGVDKDQSDLGPHILTSAVKRVDVAVFDTVKAIQEGTYEGGDDALFNLENEGVAHRDTSDKVTQDILDKVDELKQQIIDGTIKPKSSL